METILVTGARGKLGRAVAQALLKKDFNVRAATREPKRIAGSDRLRSVLLDYEEPGLFGAALEEISSVFLIAPPLDYEAPRKLMPFIDRAVEAKVRHIVFTSVLGADMDEKIPFRMIERHLMKSGVDYTILRPNFFMENFSTGWLAPMIAAGTIRVPAGHAKTSFISVEDIAQVAAVCFEEKRYGEDCSLTGSEALGYEDAARVLSNVCGRIISYEPITEEEMVLLTRGQGMSESSIRYACELFELVRRGVMAETTSIVSEVIRKPPISFEEFAWKNAEMCQIQEAA